MACEDTPAAIATAQYLEDVNRLRQAVNDPQGTGTWTTSTGREERTVPAVITWLAQYGILLSTPTLAQLQADLGWPENRVALVAEDPTPENNGIYVKHGASGQGEWVKSPVLDDVLRRIEVVAQSLEETRTDLAGTQADLEETRTDLGATKENLAGTQADLHGTDNVVRAALGAGAALGLTRQDVLRDATGLLYALGVLDGQGRLAAGVSADGGVVMGQLLAAILHQGASSYALEIGKDAAGNVPMGILQDGSSTIGKLHFGNDGDPAWALRIGDTAKNILLGLSGDGGLFSGGFHMGGDSDRAWAFKLGDASSNVLLGILLDCCVTVGNMHLSYEADDVWLFKVRDASSNVLLWIKTNGEMVVPSLGQYTAHGLRSLDPQRTDVVILNGLGQSLMQGTTSTPALSTVQERENITLNADATDFVPLIEVTRETPISGMLNTIADLIVGADLYDAPWRFLGAAFGAGGTPIQDLGKGSVYWDGMMAQIRAAVSIAAGKGWSCSAWGLAWVQGERNTVLGSNVDDYIQQLIRVKNDYAEDCAAITGQNFAPALFTYQTASHRRSNDVDVNDNAVSIAQWEAALRDREVIFACPTYHLPHNTDNLHLTNDSSKQLGIYLGVAAFKSLVMGERFRPLHPAKVYPQGNIIDMTCHVPSGGLHLDTALVSAAPNYGFDIWRAGGCDTGAITAVETVGKNRLRIILTRTLAEGDELHYGRGRPGDLATSGPADGPRGNLRDSAGDNMNYTDSTGAVRYMHNWCPMFRWLF